MVFEIINTIGIIIEIIEIAPIINILNKIVFTSSKIILSPILFDINDNEIVKRLSGRWRHWGEKYDYFKTKEDADAFEDGVKKYV